MSKNKEPVQSDEARDAIELLDNEIYSEFGNSPIGLKLQNAVLVVRRAAEQRVAPQTGVAQEVVAALRYALSVAAFDEDGKCITIDEPMNGRSFRSMERLQKALALLTAHSKGD